MSEAAPVWRPPARPPSGAPNVLVVLLDDIGFGHLGRYGSSIRTPHMDRVGTEGVSFTNFHVTALCSPTRASLLTGRHHHAVGMGFLADFDSGFAGYRGEVRHSAATLAEVLSQHGYGTYAAGKWHLTPPSQMSPTGPFDQWPTGRGFHRWYGFIGGEDDQWTPDLWYDQHHVPVPDRPGYHLSEDLAERAVEFLADHLSAAPDRPFYLHLAFGAGHAPHQVPRTYADSYRGAFDHGWDEERRRVFARQIERGIVPADTTLPPSNPDVPAWNGLTDDERRVCIRMQEVFAGFLEHTDEQFGKVLNFLSEQGVLDETVVVVLSDNGASGEGGRYGSANEYRAFLGLEEDFEEVLAAIDELGGPSTHHQYPAGWAQAGNTPLKYYKRYAFGGGVRAPLMIRYRGLGERADALQHRFQHVVDVVPTLLDVIGVEAPREHRGVAQLPLHGESFADALREFTGESGGPVGRVQYFETGGFRGLYSGGWKAVTNHRRGEDFDDDVWELYYLPDDYAESHDLAAAHPEKVASMVAEWWRQAERYGVLPLDDRGGERAVQRDPAVERLSVRLLPGVRIPNGTAGPHFGDRSFSATATAVTLTAADEGVLLAYGRRAAGFVLFVADGRLHFDLNRAGRHHLISSPPLPYGRHDLGVQVLKGAEGAVLRLTVDNEVVTEGGAPGPMPLGFGAMATQVGFNSPSAICDAYTAPFRFTGIFQAVLIQLRDDADLSPEVAFEAALRGQ